MGVEVEELRGVVTQDNKDFLKKSRENERAANKLADTLVSGAVRAAKFVAKNVQQAQQFGDGLVKQARNAGLTVEELQKLQTISDRTGIAVGSLAGIINQQNRDMQAGLKTMPFYQKALKDLGLSSKELEKLTPVERTLEQFRALAKIEDKAKRAALANDLYGSSSQTVEKIVKENIKALDQANTSLERQRIVSGEAAQNINKLTNDWKELRKQARATSTEFVGKKLAPLGIQGVESLRQISERARQPKAPAPQEKTGLDLSIKEDVAKLRLILEQNLGGE